MSKSFPDSSINVEMNSDQIFKRIIYEEGEYQNPLESPVYQMMMSIGNFSVSDLEKRYNACKKRNRQWFKYKKEFADLLISIFEKWPKE